MPNHPHIDFRSTAIRALGDGTYEVTGDITIRGVTRPIVVTVDELGQAKDPWGNERMIFNAHARLDRKDFGVKWNLGLEAGGFLVGDNVDITLEIEAVRAAKSQAA